MDREDKLKVPLRRLERVHQPRQLRRFVDIGRAMERHHSVRHAREAELARHVGGFDLRADHLETVEHDVADAADPLRRNALGAQILVGVG